MPKYVRKGMKQVMLVAELVGCDCGSCPVAVVGADGTQLRLPYRKSFAQLATDFPRDSLVVLEAMEEFDTNHNWDLQTMRTLKKSQLRYWKLAELEDIDTK